MSEPIRIGVVAEGPTDFIALEAIMRAILGEQQPIIMKQLRPQKTEPVLGGSADASQPIYEQKGWPGVHHWCQEVATSPGGRAITAHKMLILQLDVDVAGFTYESGNIFQHPDYLPLPCKKPCPPASDSADALIDVAKSWLHPVEPQPQWLWCCPAYNMETWAYAAHKSGKAQRLSNLECCTKVGKRVHKSEKYYKETYAPALKKNWAKVQALCSLARRFTTDVHACIATISPA